MKIDGFWQIVDTSKKRGGGDIDARASALKGALQGLERAEIQEFQNIYDALINKAYRWDLWAAAYIINGGCSDDGFRYFLDWLISEGSQVYQNAIDDPDSLVEVEVVEDAEAEEFAYVALQVFEEKGFGEIVRDFTIETSMPKGEEWDEEQLSNLLPKLASKYDF